MKSIICSAADAGYWHLLSGMLNSIENTAKNDGFTFGILDLGLADEQRLRISQFGAALVTPDWDYPISHFQKAPAPVYRAQTARPHLRKYFPGFDLYIWLDADCWVQDWQA